MSFCQLLADSVSYGEHRILEIAGRASIHIDCPVEVIKAILDLLERNKASYGEMRDTEFQG
ncbi:hypothetical protein WMZ97_15795 [Lentibacillus sp. N15]|uniref:hypothetical protein n=1 Tax=Lentibacillus songyuanensis TaxID=3136161 RepID=UPI0031B9FAF1